MSVLKAKISIYAEAILPTVYGKFKLYVFHNTIDDKEHLAIVKGNIEDGENIPVRIHSECLTSEVFGSLKCDCREQLEMGLKYISDQNRGVVLYMRQEGRGIGLGNKIRAYALQEKGLDTVEANHLLGYPDDLREYNIAVGMLQILGIKSVYLLTNNPKKINAIEKNGVVVKERIPLLVKPNSHNENYLYTKQKKSGHLLDFEDTFQEVDLAV